MAQSYDYCLKLLLVGDDGVGKSSIIMRFADNTFSETTIATIGVEFKIRTLNIDGKTAKLQIWDTAGQEKFRTITPSYYRGAHGVIMVYDITNSDSFANVKKWLQEVEQYGNENVKKTGGYNDYENVEVGNKSDIQAARKVTEASGTEFSDELDIPFLEVSAKSATNIEEIFKKLSRIIVEEMTI